jgi:hypothetical protein
MVSKYYLYHFKPHLITWGYSIFSLYVMSTVKDQLLPSVPDMERLRELVIDPTARATTQVC